MYANNNFTQQSGMMPPPGYYASDQPGVQPFVMYPAMTYEQQIIYRQQLAAQQRAYINKRLKENFPVKYVLLHATLLGLIGVACIAFQIALLANNSANSYIANGIWGGLICIGLALVALILLKTRAYGWFIGNMFVNVFGLMGIFGGLIIVNAITLSSGRFNCSVFNYCADTSLIGLNIAMLVLGIISFCNVHHILHCFARASARRCLGARGYNNNNINRSNEVPYPYGQPPVGGFNSQPPLAGFNSQPPLPYQNVYPNNPTNY